MAKTTNVALKSASTSQNSTDGKISSKKKKKQKNSLGWMENLFQSVEDGDEDKLKKAVKTVKDLNEKKKYEELKFEDIKKIFDGLNNFPINHDLNNNNKAKICGRYATELYRYCTVRDDSTVPPVTDTVNISTNIVNAVTATVSAATGNVQTVTLDWTVFWKSYFQSGNNYFLELLSDIGDPFLDSSDEIKCKFIKDLYAFLTKLKDSRACPFNLSGDDEEKFIYLIEISLGKCLSHLQANIDGKISENLSNMLKYCLENGPEKKGHFYLPKRINVYNKMTELILIIVLHHENQYLQTSVLRQNVKSLLNVYILNNKHLCYNEQVCACYVDTHDEYYVSVEHFIFTKSSKYLIQDVVLYVSDIIKKYHNLASFEWLEFLKQVYPVSKNEIDKNLHIFISLLENTEFEQKLKTVLLLIQTVAKQNSNLFNEQKIEMIENSCLFRDGCSSSVRNLAFQIFMGISSENAKIFKNKGDQRYYDLARKIDLDCMMTVNNIFRNVGMSNINECERVVSVMELEIDRDIDNKTFVQHALIVWKSLAIEYPAPFKKRKSILEKLKNDSKFSRNAKDVLSVIGESKSCIVM